MPTIPLDTALDWINRFNTEIQDNESTLTELDSAIGDGDHGANMARGMDAVVEKLAASTPTHYSDAFKTVGMTLVSTVGGASGPLYGTFFLRFGVNAGDVTELDTGAFGAALRAGVAGIMQRGKAELADKTMIDVWIPAVDAWEDNTASPTSAAQAALAAAEKARDATIPLVAHKGRASYLGERSAGHCDPGAASTTLLLRALNQALGAS